MMDTPVGKVARFVAGFFLECAMLAMVYMGIEISPFILAMPFGLMGFDAPEILKQIANRK